MMIESSTTTYSRARWINFYLNHRTNPWGFYSIPFWLCMIVLNLLRWITCIFFLHGAYRIAGIVLLFVSPIVFMIWIVLCVNISNMRTKENSKCSTMTGAFFYGIIEAIFELPTHFLCCCNNEQKSFIRHTIFGYLYDENIYHMVSIFRNWFDSLVVIILTIIYLVKFLKFVHGVYIALYVFVGILLGPQLYILISICCSNEFRF